MISACTVDYHIYLENIDKKAHNSTIYRTSQENRTLSNFNEGGRVKSRSVRRSIALFIFMGITIISIPFFADTTLGAVITVDNVGDGVNPGNGFCTLREAIINANSPTATDTTGGDCATGSIGSDTINLPSYSYTLTVAGTGEDACATGDLDITDDLTINGAGPADTIIQASTTPYDGIDPGIDEELGRNEIFWRRFLFFLPVRSFPFLPFFL